MNDREAVAESAQRIAAAIARRDVGTIRKLLAPGFAHRTHGGTKVDAEAFTLVIEHIPGEIKLVRLEQLEVDMSPTGALVTGFQRAQVVVDAQVVEDRRGFVDWFVKHEGEWCIQAAVDLPGPDST